jgi:hypothetical protein
MNDRVNLGPAGALRAGPFSRNGENGAAPWGKGGVGEASGTASETLVAFCRDVPEAPRMARDYGKAVIGRTVWLRR